MSNDDTATTSQPQQPPSAERLYCIYLRAFIGYLTPQVSSGHSPSRPGGGGFYSTECLDLRAHALGLRDAVAVERIGLMCGEDEADETLPRSQDDFEVTMGLKTAATVN